MCFGGLAGEKLPVVKATLWGHAKACSGAGHHWVRECIYQMDRTTCKMIHKPTSQVRVAHFWGQKPHELIAFIYLFTCFGFGNVSLCSPAWLPTWDPPECQDYRRVPTCLALYYFFCIYGCVYTYVGMHICVQVHTYVCVGVSTFVHGVCPRVWGCDSPYMHTQGPEADAASLPLGFLT